MTNKPESIILFMKIFPHMYKSTLAHSKITLPLILLGCALGAINGGNLNNTFDAIGIIIFSIALDFFCKITYLLAFYIIYYVKFIRNSSENELFYSKSSSDVAKDIIEFFV